MKKTKKVLTKGKAFIVITLVLLALFMTGCDLAGGGLSARLSPPSWIQGTWEIEINGTLIASLEFSSDNIIFQNHPAGIGLNFKELGNNKGVTITDNTVSDTVYKMTMKGSGENLIYTFTKKSDTVLDMNQNTHGVSVELKDFIKK